MPIRKMKKRHKELWIKALLSGKFKQGRGILHHDDRFCCLGVLCEVARAEGVPLRVEATSDPDSPFHMTVSYDGSSFNIPYRVDTWSGLSRSERAADTLVRMNDQGRTFKQIAAYIKRYL